jgi:RimJ/RimL family protein N-acetyltransferase
MSAANAHIAQRAAELGAQRVLAFVDIRNTASVRGFCHAGFSVCGRRRIRYRLFHRSIVTTEPMAVDGADG